MTIRRTEGIRDVTVPDLIRGRQIALRSNSPQEQRAAAVHVADRIAAGCPHPLDQGDPLATGRALAHDPVVAGELKGVLAMLGLLPDGQVAA